MTRTVGSCGVFLLVFFLMVSTPAFAGDSDWEKIGDTTLDADDSRARMRIGVEEGFYRWLKFSAQGGKVDLNKVTVNFTGGGEEVFENFTPIRDGGDTRAVTITKGLKKTISSIEVEYDIEDDASEVELIAYGRRSD